MARKRTLQTSEQVLAALAEAPSRIAALTAGLTRDHLHATAADGGWSANEVLAHLRACDDVWGGCIRAIVVEGASTLRAVNPRTWVETTDYREQDFSVSLRAFSHQRAHLVALLEPLGPEGWSRSATVTGAGRPLERTVLSYGRWLARHESPHLGQIHRAVDPVGVRSLMAEGTTRPRSAR